MPPDRADTFEAHLMATGVADYMRQPGCTEYHMWRRDDADCVLFTLVSLWTDMDAVRAYAGPAPEIAVLYADDAAFGLDPDLHVTHHHLVTSGPTCA